MGRTSGRKNPPRAVQLGDAEQRDIGESPRQDPAGSPIPSGRGNITNSETARKDIPAPEPMEEYRGMMAHGVPGDSETTGQHAAKVRGDRPPDRRTKLAPPVKPDVPVHPVPVFIVEKEGGGGVIRSASPRSFSVPVINTADPVRLCGRDPKRNRIGLLNESTTTNIRFAYTPADLNLGGGALLPWPSNSYLWLNTQDELFAVAVSGGAASTISVIQEFEREL